VAKNSQKAEWENPNAIRVFLPAYVAGLSFALLLFLEVRKKSIDARVCLFMSVRGEAEADME
jgi:hypothetical protein